MGTEAKTHTPAVRAPLSAGRHSRKGGEHASREYTPPSVTVLMAVYNDEAHLAESVASILTQDFEDFEFLIVDDASTDGSVTFLRELEARDPRVRVLRNEVNAGLGFSLARGVREAVGDYVVRMDADDVAVPGRLRRQVEFLEQHPEADIVGSSAVEIDCQGKVGARRVMPLEHAGIVDRIWACPLIHPTVAFRRQRILAVGNYNAALRRSQDYELWFRCVRGGLRFANLEEPLVYYRFDRTSHRKRPFRIALQQARIGWRGCRMLRRPLWQRIAVTVPVWRALLPRPVQHLAYRALAATVDPRRRRVGQGGVSK